MRANFEKFVSNNSNGQEMFGADIENIRNQFEALMNNPGTASREAVDALGTSISRLNTDMIRAGKTGKSFWDSFK